MTTKRFLVVLIILSQIDMNSQVQFFDPIRFVLIILKISQAIHVRGRRTVFRIEIVQKVRSLSRRVANIVK